MGFEGRGEDIGVCMYVVFMLNFGIIEDVNEVIVRIIVYSCVEGFGGYVYCVFCGGYFDYEGGLWEFGKFG